ncbi:MAG TPA: glycosyltransferase [Pirellulales bacterium]|nr:glycosyltransferase [Pirellulales bacterium]
MDVALVCDPPHAVLVHKPSWVADGFRAAGHSVRLVHDLAGVRAADAECDLLLFDHKASGLNRAALAEMARSRSVGNGLRAVPPPTAGRPIGYLGNGTESVPYRGRAIWAQWWRDLIAVDPAKPLAEQDYVRSFGAVMRGMDIVFVKERSLLDEYRQLGINAYWLDQACPAEMPACEHRGNGDGFVLPERPAGCFAQNVPVPLSPQRAEWDVLVLGSPGYAQRRADARVLAEAGFRVLWAGMPASDPVPPGIEWHPWVHPLKLPELISRCGVVLGVDWRSDLPGYTSDRTYLACGMGACYVARCDAFPCRVGPASLRAPAHHALNDVPQAALAAWVYQNTDELVDIVRHAMSDVDERRCRGERSRQLVMERHTYAHRAMEIVELLARNGRHSIAQGAAQRNPG